MNANEYQKAAYKFAAYGENATYAYAGLAEEAGEVLGKFAKFIRKHQGLEPRAASNWETFKEDYEKYRTDLKKELGDVLWMVAAIATQEKLDLADVMQDNINKLTDRLNRGVIVGEGDTIEERLANAKKENV
jgi:NTP pyrophosphatase (non-canonical NTP hydrolase)